MRSLNLRESKSSITRSHHYHELEFETCIQEISPTKSMTRLN